MKEMNFKSRLDMFWLVEAVLLFAGIISWYGVDGEGAFRSQVLLCGGIALFMCFLAFPSRLKLEEDGLYVQNGFIKMKLAYSNILGVEKSFNPFASPWAWSLVRVKVFYKKDNGTDSTSYLLLAPRQREVFIQELSKRIRK